MKCWCPNLFDNEEAKEQALGGITIRTADKSMFPLLFDIAISCQAKFICRSIYTSIRRVEALAFAHGLLESQAMWRRKCLQPRNDF